MEAPNSSIPDPTLARGTTFFQIDSLPRELITIQIGDGSGSGSWRNVGVAVSHRDVYSGYRDITDMLIYGDVDPNCNPRVALVQADSDWMPYQAVVSLILSAGPGLKTINVILRTRASRTITGNVTYTLSDGLPHISILRQSRQAVLGVSDTQIIAWSCSHPFVSYGVYLAPASDAQIDACMLLGSGTNVSGTGSWTAGQMIETSFTSADLQAIAAAASGVKSGIYPVWTTGSTFLKVFAVLADGTVTVS